MAKPKPKSKPSIPEAGRALLDGPDGLEEVLRRIGGALAWMHRDLRILRNRVVELEQAAAAQKGKP